MHFRDFLKLKEESNELLRVKDEVDWNLEAAAVASMSYIVPEARKAILYENIKGYPGKRLLSGPFVSARDKIHLGVGKILGLAPDSTLDEFYDELTKRLSYRIPPTVVTTGPCKENILLGKDANLFSLPFPYLHEGDGGRYGTFMTWIGKDPDSAWTNYGNYRLEVHTRNKLGTFLTPGQHHSDLFYQKYEARGKTMPVCICFGPDVEVMWISTIPIPRGVSEVEVAGAMANAPIELVKAETNDLLVPAHAEIVLEGESRPYERMDEGPFGEYHGYLHGPRVPQPVIRINCITYRNNPIIPFCCEGTPGGDGDNLIVSYGAPLTTMLKMLGVPAKRGWLPEGRASGFAIKISENYPGLAGDLFNLAMGGVRQGFFDRLTVVDDVEPYNLDGFLEAVFFKTHPTNFILNKTEYGKAQEGNFYLSPEEKPKALGQRFLIDATWPANWKPEEIPQKVRFESAYPSSVQEWARESWQEISKG